MKTHHYQTKTVWEGNQGKGTLTYKAYNRNHRISGEGKSISIPCASDPNFLGDPSRYNPEELLVASISACHMLWYLHLCAVNQVVVTDYEDDAEGMMEETADGSGKFLEVTLRPKISVQADALHAEEVIEKANALHHRAHKMCFIANSVNFPVKCEPIIKANPLASPSSIP